MKRLVFAVSLSSWLAGGQRIRYLTLRYGLAGGLLLTVPVVAQAQQISNTIALAALSPIAVVVLAGVVGWLERNLARGLIDVGLILLWVFVFVVFSYFVTVDWIIWSPVVLFVLHGLWLSYRLIKALVERW